MARCNWCPGSFAAFKMVPEVSSVTTVSHYSVHDPLKLSVLKETQAEMLVSCCFKL